MCGLGYIKKGTEYLLTGYITSTHQVRTSHCDLGGPWDRMDEAKKVIFSLQFSGDLKNSPSYDSQGKLVHPLGCLLFLTTFLLLIGI